MADLHISADNEGGVHAQSQRSLLGLTDPECPLGAVPDHVCRNRDGAQQEAAGQPVLRPGSRCFEGDRYAISVEAQARQASIDVLVAAQSLLAVMAEYGYLRGDCGVEAQLLADATGVAGFALSLAGWKS